MIEAKRLSVLPEGDISPSLVNEIKGLVKVRFPSKIDDRGQLTYSEFNELFPFSPKRIFWVGNVPSQVIRGAHSHHFCQQVLIPLKGSMEIFLDNTVDQCTITLDSQDCGLLLPELLWNEIKFSSEDALMLVIASHEYDSREYIHDYEQYKIIKSKGQDD